jgi:Xaa-Pro aminopeptidase
MTDADGSVGPFPHRRARSWQALADHAPEATAFLVTSLTHVRYLTGFTGSNAVLLLSDDGALLGTDGRYVVQAGEQCPDVELLVDRATLPAVVGKWQRDGGGVLAVEAQHLTVGDFRVIEDVIGAVPRETSGVVEACRVVKDASELAAIETACRISDAALQMLLPSVQVGDTERQLARRLETAMFECGADELSFATIVAAGPNSAKPHHEPTDRAVAVGDLVLFDFGAAVGGYHADMTRTIIVGEPAEWQIEIHAVVAAAQEAGREAARAGAQLADVDRSAREVVAEAGYGEFFDHGLGHGVGLQIHEAPFFSARSEGRLLAGSPVTIEPGIYLPGRGGVRIEDTIMVNDGPSRSLTSSRRDLIARG